MLPLRFGFLALITFLNAAPVAPDVAAPSLDDEAFGRSGSLRAAVALPGGELEFDVVAAEEYRWLPVMGTVVPAGAASLRGGMVNGLRAPTEPGVYALELARAGRWTPVEGWRLVVLVPFEEKRGNGYLRSYFIGRYPTEGEGRRDRYAPPAGFMEVTRANADLQLSEHFKVREFLTHDQKNVWPKYVYVDTRLLDKLELVMDELNASGVPADHMIVMSGFRTPQYNRQGLSRGRASLSRHQFGDAADVWVDNDGDWYMDDLNGDGRRDTGDARVILRAVERVERRHRELLGGAGIYRDNGAHGPFIHIDVRGRAARW